MLLHPFFIQSYASRILSGIAYVSTGGMEIHRRK